MELSPEKLIRLAQEGDMYLQEQIDEIEGKFDATVKDIKDSLPNIEEIAKSIQGKDGKDGRSILGETGEQGEMGPEGPKGRDGRDGKDGKEGRDGRDGSDGRDGTDGVDGKDGENGNDGSSDTPDEVIQKINKSRLFINKDRIDGLLESLGQVIANSVPITTSFFNGLRAKNLTINGATAVQRGDTVFLTVSGSGGGQVNSVVAGTNVTVDSTDPANPIVSATGGGSFSVMQPLSGVVNGVNKVFTWSSAPSVIVLDNGTTMNKKNITPDLTDNWTGTTTTTLQIAPTFNIYAF